MVRQPLFLGVTTLVPEEKDFVITGLPCVIHFIKKKIPWRCHIRHLLESQSRLVTILVPKVVVHAEVGLPAQLITGLTVGDALDYTTLEDIHFFLFAHVIFILMHLLSIIFHQTFILLESHRDLDFISQQ